jgi:hypothetical protein
MELTCPKDADSQAACLRGVTRNHHFVREASVFSVKSAGRSGKSR